MNSPASLPQHIDHVLVLLREQDKAACFAALEAAERAVEGTWGPVHLALRAAWCAVDIGQWSIATNHVLAAQRSVAEPAS
jgi:hypothetical protein